MGSAPTSRDARGEWTRAPHSNGDRLGKANAATIAGRLALGLQNAFLALLAMAAGSLFPIQTVSNALLARFVGGPIAATIVSGTVGWFVVIAINGTVFRQVPTVADAVSAPLPLLLIAG